MANKLIIPSRKELNLAYGNSMDSMKWLKQKIRDMRNLTSSERRFMVGKMYCFSYDPITKSNLPYYDRFPLILVLDIDREGFLGLNLHYLPPKMRYVFLNKLMNYATTNSKDEVIKLRISYEILQAVKRLSEYKPSLKRYNYPQLRTKIIPIPSSEWQEVLNLPIDKFVKAKKLEVWVDSVLEIKEEQNGS